MENTKAYIITGPTSGIGRATALELARHGTVVLVGRNRQKLAGLQKELRERGQHAIPVVCDIADMKSVKKAAEEIIALQLPIAGLLNNAGIMPAKAAKSAQGWNLTFATNYLGAFALTRHSRHNCPTVPRSYSLPRLLKTPNANRPSSWG